MHPINNYLLDGKITYLEFYHSDNLSAKALLISLQW